MFFFLTTFGPSKFFFWSDVIITTHAIIYIYIYIVNWLITDKNFDSIDKLIQFEIIKLLLFLSQLSMLKKSEEAIW